MDSDELLKALFFAVFSRVREQIRDTATMDEIDRAVRAVLDQMNVHEFPTTWDDAMPLSVGAARWREHVLRPVRVVGYVSEAHAQVVSAIPRPNGKMDYVETANAKITGVDGEHLHMLPVVGKPLIEKVQTRCKSGELVECLGFVVVLPVKIDPRRPSREPLGQAGHFYFHLADLRPSISAFDLLAATKRERDHTQRMLQKLRSQGVSPFDFLRDQLFKGLGIVAKNIAPYMVAGIEFVILQAVSNGTVGNAPARLHALIPGPPGQGKKLIQLAARALNPVCQEAPPTRCTAAGLVGASYQTSDGWNSKPGLLPLASGGVLCIQDAHGWNAAKFALLASILHDVMEDGVTRDAVAGGETRIARTSLLIDLNRYAQLRLGSQALDTEAPLLTSLPVLSRVDTIIEIPVDAERAFAVATQMYEKLRQGALPLDRQTWVRSARLIVAALRDEHPVIDTSEVIGRLRASHRDFQAELAELIEKKPEVASAVATRMAINMTRLVLASARAHDRKYANESDVQRAAVYVRRKLAFVSTLALNPSLQATGSAARSAKRDAYYNANWRGRRTNPAEVAMAYARDTGTVVSAKTVARDLERLGATGPHGVWLLPAPPDDDGMGD